MHWAKNLQLPLGMALAMLTLAGITTTEAKLWPKPGCAPGPWLTPAERRFREARLHRYLVQEQARVDRCDLGPPGPLCLWDDHRLYGYEHPAWPKPPLSPGAAADRCRLRLDAGPVAKRSRSEVAHEKREACRSDFPFVLEGSRNGTLYRMHTLWRAGSLGSNNWLRSRGGFQPWTACSREVHRQHTAQNLLVTREPLARFASGALEVAGRLGWRFCNASRLLERMVAEAECPVACLWPRRDREPRPHLYSASAFYASPRYNPHPEHPAKRGRIEYHQLMTLGRGASTRGTHSRDLESMLRDLAPAAVRHGSAAPDRHPGRQYPGLNTSDLLAELRLRRPDLTRRLCRVLAADFLCFGWPVPSVCGFLMD